MKKHSLAKSLIEFLGNKTPNKKQIKTVESMLFNVGLKAKMLFDKRLTKREKECLSLAALGHSSTETAELLKISRKTVEQYRGEIKKKLKCKNMTHAIIRGIKYGYITPTEEGNTTVLKEQVVGFDV